MTIDIYTKPLCPYCSRAIAILKRHGVSFSEHGSQMNSRAVNDGVREAMIQRTGGPSSYPQIFIGDTYVGGSDDLAAMDRDGRLAALLKEIPKFGEM